MYTAHMKGQVFHSCKHHAGLDDQQVYVPGIRNPEQNMLQTTSTIHFVYELTTVQDDIHHCNIAMANEDVCSELACLNQMTQSV